MFSYKNQILYAVAVILILFISGCELFFLEELPRNNPFDPNNPVPPAENIAATVTDIGTNVLILLSWDNRGTVPGYHIVRKAGEQAPVNASDGVVISTFEITQDSNTGRYFLQDSVPEYTPGGSTPQSYTYRIWTTDRKDHFTDSGSITADLSL